MTDPTPHTDLDHLLERLCRVLGESTPDWAPLLRDLAPDMLVQLHSSDQDSLNRTECTLAQKERHLIALAAALATSHTTCARTQARLALLAGASDEEILDAVRITRHIAAAGALDAAEGLLKDMARRRKEE